MHIFLENLIDKVIRKSIHMVDYKIKVIQNMCIKLSHKFDT